MPVPTRRLVQTGAAAAIGLSLTTAALAGTAPAQATAYDDELTAVRAVSARYHSVEQALKAGYRPTPECVSSPAGAMGTHYENAALMASPEVDPLRPEILLYAPGSSGRPELVAVEYWRAAAGLTAAPTLFGRSFDGPMAGHHPAMPVHYDMHVWLWADNPTGTFAPFNPSLSC